jgi:biopolymer transport protein ExbB/TolQ
MDSFIGIARTNTTNLAVVAPSMGLITAIPAVVM